MNKSTENKGAGYMFLGEHIHEQRVSSGLKALAMAVRLGEPPLGSLSLAEQNWIVTALTHLIKIDEYRNAAKREKSAHCIFEVGCIYFQCLAPYYARQLRCEAVSAKSVPELGVVLTPKKEDRLMREFGFNAPGHSPNFSQTIDIKSDDDLAYVARMAFRVLRNIYDVKDFGAAKFNLSIPNSDALSISKQAEPLTEKPYVVFVDDNFHYMDEDERYKKSDYDTFEAAVQACQKIVDDFLKGQYKPGMSSEELFDQYTNFGEDPFIRGPRTDFSAWGYASQRCRALCGYQIDNKGD